MKKLLPTGITLVLLISVSLAQTPQTPSPSPQEVAPDDVVRISTSLVQTDVMVTDNLPILPETATMREAVVQLAERQASGTTIRAIRKR